MSYYAREINKTCDQQYRSNDVQMSQVFSDRRQKVCTMYREQTTKITSAHSSGKGRFMYKTFSVTLHVTAETVSNYRLKDALPVS